MRLALHSLWRKPVFALAAIFTVALGVGANTALFSVIYTVLIQPLPFRDPGSLVQLWEKHPALPQLQVAAPDYQDWRAQTRSYREMTAYTLSAMNTGTLLGQGEPEVVHATMAEGNLFSTMGIRLLAGRSFSAQEEREKGKVALLSESLWRRKFAADPGVIGRQVRVDGQSFSVIGIVPARQAFPEWADLWIPLSLLEPALQTRRKTHPLEVIARLRPGVSEQQAQTEIQSIARRLAQSYPDTNGNVGAFAIPLARQMTGAVRPALLLVWAAVGLVLLMACVNLAHLFLARLIERSQEMNIRRALGAGPWQLARQVLGEALLLAALGGAAGIASALGTSRLLGKLAAGQIGRIAWTGLEAPVWLFAATISLAGGLLFALPACWQVLRPRRRLAGSGRGIARGRSRSSAFLVAAQVAMALLVLTGVALLTRSFAALLGEDPGFRAANVWTVPNLPLGNAQFRPALLRVPGVVDVAAVNSAPMSLTAAEHSRFATRFGIEGRTFDAGSFPVAQNHWSTPQFFEVLGIPLRSGRLLTEKDAGQPRVAVNETLARRFFPRGDALGKRLMLGVMDPQPQAFEIVGVVGDVREFGLDQEVEPAIYGIFTGPVVTLLVKTAGPGAFAKPIHDAIQGIDPAIPVAGIHPLAGNVEESLARRRFALILLAIFGGMAAFLTAAGIYGLLAQSVSARVREFGVRAAVGAAPGELVGMILREAFLLTVPGLVAGVALALAFAGVMKSFVYRLSGADPVSIGAAALFLAVLTLASAFFPARRAASVDPASALRSD